MLTSSQIEANHDPRQGPSETTRPTGNNPLVDEMWDHRPWPDLHDDEDHVAQSDPRSNNQRSTFSGSFYSSTAQPGGSFGLQPGGAFASMMQSMLGPSSSFAVPRQGPGTSGHPRPQSVPGSWPAAQAPGDRPQLGHPLHFSFNGDSGSAAFTTTIGPLFFGQGADRGSGQDMGPVNIAESVYTSVARLLLDGLPFAA